MPRPRTKEIKPGDTVNVQVYLPYEMSKALHLAARINKRADSDYVERLIETNLVSLGLWKDPVADELAQYQRELAQP